MKRAIAGVISMWAMVAAVAFGVWIARADGQRVSAVSLNLPLQAQVSIDGAYTDSKGRVWAQGLTVKAPNVSTEKLRPVYFEPEGGGPTITLWFGKRDEVLAWSVAGGGQNRLKR